VPPAALCEAHTSDRKQGCKTIFAEAGSTLSGRRECCWFGLIYWSRPFKRWDEKYWSKVGFPGRQYLSGRLSYLDFCFSTITSPSPNSLHSCISPADCCHGSVSAYVVYYLLIGGLFRYSHRLHQGGMALSSWFYRDWFFMPQGDVRAVDGFSFFQNFTTLMNYLHLACSRSERPWMIGISRGEQEGKKRAREKRVGLQNKRWVFFPFLLKML